MKREHRKKMVAPIVITILFAVIVYVILLFAMKIINEKKLRMIPGGTRLVPV